MPLRWKDEWTPWFAAFCASCVVATWLAGSTQFHCHDADSLVPKLTSTMEWSFFYWHTDRNGQLLPFLAMPFTHPLTNLVVQQWLGTCAGVMAIYMLVAFSMPGRDWFASGTAAAACFLVGATAFGHTLYLEGSQTYGTGMAFVLGGLLVARRATVRREDAVRIAVATMLMVVGLWVNLMVFLLAAVLVAAEAAVADNDASPGIPPDNPWMRHLPRMPVALRRWLGRAGAPLAVLVGSLVVSVVIARLCAAGGGENRLTFAFTPLFRYPDAVATAVRTTCDMVVGPGGAMLVVAAAIAAAWLEGRDAWPRSVTVLASAACGFVGLVAGMQWVAMNGSHPRYLLPATIAAYASIGSLYVTVFKETLGTAFQATHHVVWARCAIAAVLPAVLLHLYGWPDPAASRRAIAGVGSPLAEKVVDSGVEFVAGDYWSLWPVVFKANLILYERGETRRVWGLGCRASDTRHRWELDRHGGTATVAHLARTPQPCGHSLDWIAKHLDLEIGDREESVGDLELYRFRLRDDRIARR